MSYLYIIFHIKTTSPVMHYLYAYLASHQWLNNRGACYHTFEWQKGYGVFSISPTNLQAVRQYIQHQAEHHQRLTARDEYLQLLQQCRIEPTASPFLLQD